MAFAAATHSRDLTDEHWDLIDRFLPEPVRRADGRGRPWKETPAVLNGILWIQRTGEPWAAVPDRYPSYQTCRRRFQQWVRVGVLRSILEILAQALHDQDYLDLQEAFIDGSFAPAKQSGACVGKTKRGKGCGTGAPWRGTDRATPEDPEIADARRSPAASLPTAAESRTTLCLVQNFRRIVVRYERWPRTFSGCYTWPAASFCCGVMRWLLFQSIENAGWDQGRRRQWALPTPRAHLAGWRLHHRQHGLANTAAGG